MNKLLAAIFLYLLVSVAGAQQDPTVMAYSKSIEREKIPDYFGAIRYITGLNDSNSYYNNLRLGWLYYKAGLEKKSLQHYKNAIKLRPDAIEPRVGFGYPAYLLQDFEELIDEDKKILAIDPGNKNINSNLGQIYYYDKQYAKALPYLQKVAQMYPFDYDNNLLLAWNYLRLDNKTEAEKYFNLALLYSPGDASAKEGLENIGKAGEGSLPLIKLFEKSYGFSANSDHKAAAGALTENYEKGSYFVNLRLGWLMYLAGQHSEAVDYYKQAIDINPNSVEAKLGILYPLEATGNANETKIMCENILSIDPQNSTIIYKLGYLYYQKKEYGKAAPYFEKLVKLYPFGYDGLLMHAWTCYYTGRYAESKAVFTKVLCTSPGDQSALQGLALKSPDEQQKLEKKEIIKPK